jgi:hypothetical protein
MAQLSSRKTLVRAGSVAGTTAGAAYLFNEALGGRGGIPPVVLGTTALAAGGLTAFFETQDAS